MSNMTVSQMPFLTLLILSVDIISVVGTRNVLLIIVDDLRPSIGCYGDEKAHTPNIDILAHQGIVFTNAFAQQALCAPSRNSFLTGRRPDTLRLYDVHGYWRNTVGNFTTLPEHLKNNGYMTMSIGKVFHPGSSSNGSDDYPYSWTEKPFHPFTERYKNAPLCRENPNSVPRQNLVCPVDISEMPDGTLPDIETLDAANIFLENRRQDKKPFFLAVGFQKPHIPFKYPRKYLKYHPLDKFKIPDHYEWPTNLSSVAYNPWIDLRKRDDVKALRLKFPYEKIPVDFATLIIQSYYSAVTYIDDLIGMLLKQLSTCNLEENTTIFFTSDHGWSLGEHAEWAKYSNFEVAIRVPVIVSIPGVTFSTTSNLSRSTSPISPKHNNSLKTETSRRRSYLKIDSLIELVDIYPTIADIVGLQVPLCAATNQTNLCTEGLSFLPVIRTAVSGNDISWKSATFSQYPRPGVTPTLHPNSDEPRSSKITIMGYTIRTMIFRYIAWLPFEVRTARGNWTDIIAEELYDHRVDAAENLNVADVKKYKKIKNQLKRRLQDGWRNALPHV